MSREFAPGDFATGWVFGPFCRGFRGFGVAGTVSVNAPGPGGQTVVNQIKQNNRKNKTNENENENKHQSYMENVAGTLSGWRSSRYFAPVVGWPEEPGTDDERL